MAGEVNLRYLLLVATFTLPFVLSQKWEDPPFINQNPRDEVEYAEYEERGQIIRMEEEIEGEVNLSLFNYAGSNEPKVTVIVGDTLTLGAEVRQGEAVDGKKWYLIIKNRQDYEIPSQRLYNMRVTLENRTVLLILEIVNIDDNPPVIQGPTCQVPELYLGITNCTYKVTDADGILSIEAMNFYIDGRAGEEEIFDILEDRNDTTGMSMMITLETVQELDFLKSQIHIFTITANDSAANTGEVNAVVQVIDVPNQPPIWKTIFASQNFDEKTSQSFKVEAVDGDTQINKQILYKLYKKPEYTFFEIGREDGILTVAPIDRDTLEQEVFSFTISAYKVDNETWETTSEVFIIVNDINDQIPIVLHEEFNLTIDEETFLSLEFDPKIFIHDRDLGENAQYTVELESINPPDAADAFVIVPNEGYQKQEFKIIILDAPRLDYENTTWQNIELKIKAIEKKNSSHIGTAKVKINLINWNDEEPIFDEESYSVSVNETVGKGYEIATVHATDIDVGDSVTHSLIGSVQNYLHIDPTSGLITVTVDNAFDYNRQEEIIVQVMAKDNLGEPYHTTYAQLTIKLIDVNNKPPEIRMPAKTTSVEENSPEGFKITDEILGSDPDKSAHIEFSIDWAKSSASKPGKTVKREEFENCVDIQTIYPDPNKLGTALGQLTVKEIRNNVTIDFEEFEFLYLAIKLTDRNQVIGPGTAEGTLSLVIIDVNDNAPQWVNGSLQTKRIVREGSESEIFIGSVIATDIDGPLYNQVKYYLMERNNTSVGLVSIDITTGQLTVKGNKEITCDYPDPKDKLYYTLTASDCQKYDDNDEQCFRTPGQIEIDIIDVNNKYPNPLDGLFNSTIEIYENSPTGTYITKVLGRDLDRDEPYRTIFYSINFEGQTELQKLFSVDSASGELIVNLEDGEVLDFDEEPNKYDIFITLKDNPLQEGDGQRNQNVTTVKVILLDENDNAPQLPDDLSWIVTENAQNGVKLKPEVIAPDKDEPGTNNSCVQYNILSLSSKNDDIFTIHSPDCVRGILQTEIPLKGLWGSYKIELEAYDLGIPRMNTTKTYDLTISPYNYEKPTFVFPIKNQLYRLKKEANVPNNTLYFADLTKFTEIYASDPDGLEAGKVSFEVTGNEKAKEYFTIDSQSDNKGRLVLLKALDTVTEFQVTIKAKDHGTDPFSREEEVTFTILFVPTEGAPYFVNNNATTKFTEFSAGMSENTTFVLAEDPKNINCTVGCAEIFYFILQDGPSAQYFQLDKVTNVMTLKKELNRNEQNKHSIRIAATNSRDQVDVVASESILNVDVLVREANPMPRFKETLYAGGVSLTDKIGKQMFILQASHTEELPIKYKMLYETMVVDPSLEAVKNTAFTLDENTGELLLKFAPQASMSGMFEFNATATDTADKVDTTMVKVFIIADNNRVSFIFENVEQQIQEQRKFISDTLTARFGYQCNIDYVLIASENGVAKENQTEVRTHFIENSVAVDASKITVLLTDLTLMRNLRDDLREKKLYLEDFSTTKTDNITDSLERMLIIILIVVSSVLGVLCIILLVAFCLRTKSLNRRLQALSETKFGSQDSGLNRVGVAVPGTNKHALEGSNPVWNEDIKAPDFDSISNVSGDSDLIGVEDDPQFGYDNSAKNPKRNTQRFEKKNNGTASRRPTKNNIQGLGEEQDT